MLAIFCFASENLVGTVSEMNNKSRLYILDAFMLVCLLATVNFWRGLWMLADLYISNDNKIIFLLNGVSWKLLMLLNCSESLSGRGILKDDDEIGRNCVKLPIQYFQKVLKIDETNVREEKAINEIVMSTKL